MTHADAVKLLQDDPLLQTSTRAWLSCQQLSWRGLQEEFEGNADKYLAELEAVDKRGPGTLELNPGLKLPAYTRHEIHIQQLQNLWGRDYVEGSDAEKALKKLATEILREDDAVMKLIHTVWPKSDPLQKLSDGVNQT